MKAAVGMVLTGELEVLVFRAQEAVVAGEGSKEERTGAEVSVQATVKGE